jgi:ribosomal protein S18 acetylase RimI-like enzyme
MINSRYKGLLVQERTYLTTLFAGGKGFRATALFHLSQGQPMIRPTVPSDTPTLVDLAQATGVFKPIEIEALQEVLDDYHDLMHRHGHVCITFEQGGAIIGFAYYAPTAMTDRGWHLYWIAVSKTTQARGVGGQLLRHVEDDIRRARGRQLLIETSSLPHYELTRRFYLKHGYEQAAVLPDYYADGDDMVVFRKQLSP